MLTFHSERNSPPNILYQGAKGQGQGARLEGCEPRTAVTSMYYNTRGMDGETGRILAKNYRPPSPS
jgi:hypothetical protein